MISTSRDHVRSHHSSFQTLFAVSPLYPQVLFSPLLQPLSTKTPPLDHIDQDQEEDQQENDHSRVRPVAAVAVINKILDAILFYSNLRFYVQHRFQDRQEKCLRKQHFRGFSVPVVPRICHRPRNSLLPSGRHSEMQDVPFLHLIAVPQTK